jgi:hypothetical protein
MFLASAADGVAPDDPGVTRSVLLTTGSYGAALYFSLVDNVFAGAMVAWLLRFWWMCESAGSRRRVAALNL